MILVAKRSVAASIAAAATIFIQSTTVVPPANSIDIMPQWRYNTAQDIPIENYKTHKVIYGKTVKVIDGDTIRIRHLPFYPLWRGGTDFQGLLSENTISVRAYGVDAPEIAKFGNPSMPRAEEARDYAEKLVGQKVVRVKLLRKDQYGRAVAKIQTRGILPLVTKRDLTKDLAKNGYGTLYTGGGAEYDGKREELEKLIESAQRNRRGIWSEGTNVQTPAEYKRAMKASKSK
mmetsp:Transcript_29262/g.42965  ORF Transcript_29262/g.42965 Transcript_29262/m.42965 type:complete len:232 (-) Transcript_29262:132-827(-)